MRFLAFSLLFLATAAQAKIVTATVEYRQDGVPLEGFMAYDDAKAGKRPGVLIVHEWTGLGSYVKSRAEKLAALGYVAFAADIYGKGIRPANPKDAGVTAGIYKSNRGLFRARLLAALDELKKKKNVDLSRLAAIGYCFGGTGVIELARTGADLKGVVSFHGGLDDPAPGDDKNIRAKVLALAGADDPFVPAADIQKFESGLRAANVDWQLVEYSGTVHSFTNPDAGDDNSKGAAYNARSDRRSWQAMQDFFREIFPH